MKLKLSGNNLNASLTNDKDEPIYTYRADALSVELDVAKLAECIDEIQKMVLAAMEKALNDPATQVTPGSSDPN